MKILNASIWNLLAYFLAYLAFKVNFAPMVKTATRGSLENAPITIGTSLRAAKETVHHNWDKKLTPVSDKIFLLNWKIKQWKIKSLVVWLFMSRRGWGHPSPLLLIFMKVIHFLSISMTSNICWQILPKPTKQPQYILLEDGCSNSSWIWDKIHQRLVYFSYTSAKSNVAIMLNFSAIYITIF